MLWNTKDMASQNVRSQIPSFFRASLYIKTHQRITSQYLTKKTSCSMKYQNVFMPMLIPRETPSIKLVSLSLHLMRNSFLPF